MKVTLTKHGGLAAGMRRPPCVVESSTLSPVAAVELGRLVSAAQAKPAAVAEKPESARDAISYSITIEEGGKVTTLRQSDVTVTREFTALVDWLERQSSH